MSSEGPLLAADRRVAYFTMEVALDSRLPTYSGGLGVLAGDFLMSAADLALPVVGVSLAYSGGYFRQVITDDGRQRAEPVVWERAQLLERLEPKVTIELEGARVAIGAWQHSIAGAGGARVPVVFLDTDLPENDAEGRRITDQLYSGDDEHRLRQEAVLGIGGVEMLRELGFGPGGMYHMNEGHSSLLTLRLLEGELGSGAIPSPAQREAVRARCVFTTHTPVPAGHDRFSAELVTKVLGTQRASLLDVAGYLQGSQLNMTTLGAGLSGYVNAVSLKHRDVTRAMLPGIDVQAITNGVHHVRWASAEHRVLFDRHLPGWRQDAATLRYSSQIPLEEIREAHATAKRRLCGVVRQLGGVEMSADGFTIGLARRVTPYKRTLLLFSDTDRLVAIAEKHGPIQVVCSGKAHPRDKAGQDVIAELISIGRRLPEAVKFTFLENYDLDIAGSISAGSDLWLNTPEAPFEASGTSGMKAALSGVPSLSILDGWWIEGWIEGVTGWAIDAGSGSREAGSFASLAAFELGDEGVGDVRLEGRSETAAEGREGGVGREPAAGIGQQAASQGDFDDAAALYDKLGQVVVPMYYGESDRYLEVGRSAIAINGPFFSTERMAREYARLAYRLQA